MVLFSLKIFKNLRKAIAGRRYPAQLAGGLALGVLLGIIPHGNLLAVVVLMGILCFQVNHAFLAVIAIASAYGAAYLDPYSHQVGEFLLTHPTGNALARRTWTFPLVPWMDLNNTVVLGSFTIGLLATLPLFVLSYPVFKWLAPPPEADSTEPDPVVEQSEASAKITRVDAPESPSVVTAKDRGTSGKEHPADYRSLEAVPVRHETLRVDKTPIDEVLESE
ncbi:MAG: TIGR03546 family protein, partial [Planctomycetota bacterium]